MRKNKNALGILAVAVTFVLALTGCPRLDPPPTDPGTSAPESRAPFGETMVLTGQVYAWDPDAEEYWRFDGDRDVGPAWAPLGRDIGGEGTINGGQLHFIIATPSHLTNIGSLFENYNDIYSGFTIYPHSARAVSFYIMETEGDDRRGRLQRLSSDVSETENMLTSIIDEVYYIYVDREVTIIGRGKSDANSGFLEGRPFSYAWRFDDINIVLEAGWNVIHIRSVTTIEDGHVSQVGSMAAYNPGWVRWGLWESKDGDVVSLGLEPPRTASAGFLSPQARKTRLIDTCHTFR